MSGKYTEFEKLVNGKLRIALLDEGRESVQEIAAKEISADSKLAETIEWQLCNGWSMLRPEDIGALTEAPILSEEADFDNQGVSHNVGTVYWYPQVRRVRPGGQAAQ